MNTKKEAEELKKKLANPPACEQCAKKESIIGTLLKQSEDLYRQLGLSQKKALSQRPRNDCIVSELTKQLEIRIKDVEMLKDMLRSSKIDLLRREREVKHLRARMVASTQRRSRMNPPTGAAATPTSRNPAQSSGRIASRHNGGDSTGKRLVSGLVLDASYISRRGYGVDESKNLEEETAKVGADSIGNITTECQIKLPPIQDLPRNKSVYS